MVEDYPPANINTVVEIISHHPRIPTHLWIQDDG